MAATIEILPSGQPIAYLGDSHHICLDGKSVIIVCSSHQAEWFCRKLNAARESSLHNALNILIEQLGFSEDEAKHLYMELKGSDFPTMSRSMN